MSKNSVQTRGAKSKAKCETVNRQSDSDQEFKFKQEESMDTNLSEASTLDLEDTAESERSNSASKRKLFNPALLVSNLPENYSLRQMINYLEKLCGPCEVNFSENRSGNRTVEVVFPNTPQRTKAKNILNAQCIDKVNIRAETPDYDSDMEPDQDGPQAKRKKDGEDVPWGIDMDVWRPDPKGWYGVKPQYLNTLGISEPLQNWVLVINFRCGREELKDLLELAGDVLVCSVQNMSTSNRYANVMYRHPLEALQAVSMFNGQMFYGRPLTVKIIKETGVILPKGLNNVGPGFAKFGKPLRDVVRHYERFINGKDSGLNCNLFRTPQEQCNNDEDNSEIDDSDRKAREALETLVNLVSQGMKVKDLVEELKSIILDMKENPIEQILKELEASDIESKDKNESDARDRNVSKEENDNARSSSVNSNSRNSYKSTTASPDHNKSSKDVTEKMASTRPISTVSLNRPSESGSRSLSGSKSQAIVKPDWSNPTKQTSPAPGGSGGYRPSGPGPMPGPIRPTGPGGPMFGPRGPMPGPRSGPMMGPMPRQMPGSMSGPMTGPMPGPNSGPICGPMSGPMSGPNGPMAISGPAGPMSGPMPGPNFSMCGPNTQPPFGPSMNPTSGPEATLQFSNLPLSTTFALLSDKLSQVGQVVSIQFTVPGCVVAKFAHRLHAERCIQANESTSASEEDTTIRKEAPQETQQELFDKTRLEGNLIDVRFI